MPDPFSNEYPSFGAANNARLRAFLDRFGFDYEFASSTGLLRGRALRCDAPQDARALRRHHGDHAAVAARGAAQSYSPFLPIHPKTGSRHAGARSRSATSTPARSSGAIPTAASASTTPVTGGHAKLQWKPDWAMRWAALGVDYEMSGQGPDRQRQARRADLRRSTRRRPRASTTSCSSTRTARRSRSRRATA